MIVAVDAVIRAAIGDVDGVNRDYTTPETYEAGTLRVIHNGLTRLEGYVETSTTSFRMDVAPRTGDVLLTYYGRP